MSGGSALLPDPWPVEAELRIVELPLVNPHSASHGTESARRVVLVALRDRLGSTGWGECPTLSLPSYTPEWTTGAWSLLRSHLAPAVLAGARPPFAARGNEMARAAVEAALVDLAGRQRGFGLAEAMGAILGCPPTAVVRSTAVLGVSSDIESLLSAASKKAASGHTGLKLKVQPGWLGRPVRAVAGLLPGIALSVDANGSFSGRTDDLIDELDGIEELVSYVEQPFAADELVEHADLRRRTPVPLALDESVTSPGRLRTALRLGSCDVVSVKPARLGGVGPTLEVLRVLADSGVPGFVGGMLETGVGRALALAVAAQRAAGMPADLGPSSAYFRRDVCSHVDMGRDGTLPVPVGSGIGVQPDADLLGDATVVVSILQS